jgi:hypothetical protein
MLCFLLLINLSWQQAIAQHQFFEPIPTPEWIEQHKDSLREALLKNKQIPNEYEHSILAALMYYPELEKSHIHFKTRRISTTMAALPTVGSIFKNIDKRRYSIIINYRKNRRLAPLIMELPFEARVGVFGHELAHILDYNNKSYIRIVFNGIAYSASKSFKRNLEYKIDRITVNRGLGNGLFTFRKFIEEEAITTERYKRFKDKVYMSSAEISKMIESFDELAEE